MNKTLKISLLVVVVLAAIGATAAWLMWNKPRRNVEKEKGIEVTAVQLVKEYQANETQANAKYLDKAIQVTGTITEMKENQDGKTAVILASEDAFSGVFCTLKEKTTALNSGSSVTIKGICSGMLSDVRLSNAVIVK